MPGTAAGTVRRKQRTVASATASTGACRGDAAPGSTMLGFSSMPSSRTLCFQSAPKTVCRVASVTSRQRSMVLSRRPGRMDGAHKVDCGSSQPETQTRSPMLNEPRFSGTTNELSSKRIMVQPWGPG